jgi:hypothetical protein
MQCKDVEAVLEQEGLAPLPEAARIHLAGCSNCRYLLADLSSIVNATSEFPAEVEPPARIWISLRAQLEAEGIIHPPEVVSWTSSPWWQSLVELFRSRSFATAAVGLALLVSALYQLRGPINEPVARPDLFADTALALSQQEHDLSSVQLASTSAVDASFRQNLQTINAFIAECELRLKEEPQDELAREYLSRAYQQKAELLSAMMEQSGSLH